MRFAHVVFAAGAMVAAKAQEDPPINDACPQATLLSVDVPVSSSLMSATYDANVPSCPFPGEGQYLNECFHTLPGCRGVWYQVVGTGDTLKVSTCDDNTEFATQLAVYDSDVCSSMECIAWNDFEDIAFCGETSTVSWKTTPGVNYTVFLRPAWLDSFEYRETDMNYAITLSQVATQANEKCSNAEELSIPSETIGTLTGSSPPEKVCGESESLHGVWYTIQAEADGLLDASVCSTVYDDVDCASSYPELPSVCRDCENVMLRGCVLPVILESYPPKYSCESYGPGLSIFQLDDGGSSCEDLTCVEESTTSKCRITWAVKAGRTYHILVHGATSSAFSLTLSEVAEYPDSVCANSPDTNPADDVSNNDDGPAPVTSAGPSTFSHTVTAMLLSLYMIRAAIAF